MSDNEHNTNDITAWESPYVKARRLGAEAAARGEGWQANPYTPGTRQWFEFDDQLPKE